MSDDIGARVTSLEERVNDLDRRILILEVSGAERHKAVLTAIQTLQSHLESRVARLEWALWGTIAAVGGTLLLAAARVLFKGV